MCKGKCIVFVGFDSAKKHRKYPDAEQRLLIFFAQMLMNIRLRKHAEEQLQKANCNPKEAMMHADSGGTEVAGENDAGNGYSLAVK